MNTQKNNIKILFLASNYKNYYEFILTGALDSIKDKVTFLAHPGLAKYNLGVPEDRVEFYTYPGKKDIYHRHIFNINTWQRRKQNAIFSLRIKRLNRRQLRVYPILSLPILSSLVKSYFLYRAYDEELFQKVKKINPSIIVIPSHAFDGLTFELIRIARKLKIPSFMIAENWDSLPNKTIFTLKPDYLGVWSEQGVEHAIKYREMNKEQVFTLGAPKFIEYMKPEVRKQSSPYPFKYILYVGISEQYDELKTLKKIDELIDKYKIGLKVVFRPAVTQHTRKCADVFFEYDFKNIVLDTQSRIYYKKSSSWDISQDSFNSVYYPDLSYYSRLLANMEFMICPLSTMLLEASLFHKKVYVAAYDDGLHELGLKYLFYKVIHLRGIEKMANMRMIFDFNDMEKIFAPGDQLKLKGSEEPIEIDYFISREKTVNYAANLKKVIDNILTGSLPSKLVLLQQKQKFQKIRYPIHES